MKLNPSTEIVSIEFIDVDTNELISLSEKLNSRCHFQDTFKCKEYFIQLRLDWKDLDEQNDPTLDADIWKKEKGKKVFIKKGPWHHSKKVTNKKTGKREYIFKFESLELHLATKATIGKTLSAKANITDSLSIEHKKG